MGPVAPAERIEVIDILRGWAIFGILLVNLSHDLPWDYLLEKQWPDTANRIALETVRFLASGKFVTLFSFLFGLGFALQMMRAERRGVRLGSIYIRRLIVLLLIGVVHQLLGPWDIVHIYALLGFLLLFFHRLPLRAVVIVCFLCALVGHLCLAIGPYREQVLLADPRTAQQATREVAERNGQNRALDEQDLRVHSKGSFAQISMFQAKKRFLRYHARVRSYLSWLAEIFPLLLLGLYAGRRRIFEGLPAHLPTLCRLRWWGLGLGIFCTAVWEIAKKMSTPVWPIVTEYGGELLWLVGAASLGGFYAVSLLLLAQREPWRRRLAPLAAVGRMALSNYLLHSVVIVALSYSYGFGLYGRWGPLTGVGLAFLIFPLQVLLSVWWLRRFRFGPAEWLWRTLTYGKLQPMRLRPAVAPGA